MSDDITYSDFWLPEQTESIEYIELIKMAQHRRAISNFVNILTEKNIPVVFNSIEKNATDGEVVYLSPKLKSRKDYDVAVGLSLHEGSHIVYSDFVIIKTLWQRIPRDLYDLVDGKNIPKSTICGLVKSMTNYVEDRFIDAMVYSTAPGYRGYYLALYDKYFNFKGNAGVLKSKMFRYPSIRSYEFRIINFTCDGTDLDALPDLRNIHELIDIPNILRLEKPIDRFEIAIGVCRFILANLGKEEEESKSKGNSTPSPVKINGSGESESTEEQDETDGTDSDEESGEGDAGDSDDKNDPIGGTPTSTDVVGQEKNVEEDSDLETKVGDTSELSQSVIDTVIRNLEKQKKFLDGDVKRGTISAKDNLTVDAVDRSGMSIIRVGKDAFKGKKNFKGIECVVVKKLTNELLHDENFPMRDRLMDSHGKSRLLTSVDRLSQAVTDGVVKGRQLGRKLQVRNDVNVIRYNRQKKGKIDRRLLSECGYESTDIFFNDKFEKYNDSHVHISVDASQSMCGLKWFKTITTVVAICKAASMVSNIRVTVSFRTTVTAAFAGGHAPYVLMAYDSKIDSFSKITSQFKHLYPANTTPEGLAFEAILDVLPISSFGEDKYFLNFSDGQPYFTYAFDDGSTLEYVNEVGTEHTRIQIKKIKSMGYRVLSYFICDENNRSENDTLRKDFQAMYGKSAAYVDVNNITKIANTLNAMFLQKE